MSRSKRISTKKQINIKNLIFKKKEKCLSNYMNKMAIKHQQEEF